MRHFLLFLATAGLITFFLDRLLPPVGERITDVKLASFAERRNDYDVLVLGSSQTFRGIDPSAFDARTRQAGLETRTFNLGIPGATLVEAHGVLRRVAELEPARLRWILIEADNVIRLGDDSQFLTRKSIAVHDPETTRLLWPYLGELGDRASRQSLARWRSLVALAYRLAGVGRAIPWVEAAIGVGVSADERAEWLGPLENGYRNIEDAKGEGRDGRRKDFLERPGFYENRMGRLRRKRSQLAVSTPGARPFFVRLEDHARALGAQAIFFTIRRGDDAQVLAREGEIEALIEFDDPPRYPELYDAALTFDGSHLNRAGSRIFTDLLADAFAARVKSEAR